MTKRMIDISLNDWVAVNTPTGKGSVLCSIKRARELTHDDFSGYSLVSGTFKTRKEAVAWADKNFIDEYVLGDD